MKQWQKTAVTLYHGYNTPQMKKYHADRLRLYETQENKLSLQIIPNLQNTTVTKLRLTKNHSERKPTLKNYTEKMRKHQSDKLQQC